MLFPHAIATGLTSPYSVLKETELEVTLPMMAGAHWLLLTTQTFWPCEEEGKGRRGREGGDGEGE